MSSRGARPRLHSACAWHPFPPGKFVEAGPDALFPCALLAGGGASPPPPPGPRPQPQPLPGCTPSSPAHSLRPGHGAATATLPSPTEEGADSNGGKEAKDRRVAPDVTGVADELRSPLHRPPRPSSPCALAPGVGATSPDRRAWAPWVPRLGVPSETVLHPHSRDVPQAAIRPGRLGREPGAAAGTAATPAQAGPATLGPEHAGGGGGDGDPGRGGRRRRTGQPSWQAQRLTPTDSRAPGAPVQPRWPRPARFGGQSWACPRHTALSPSRPGKTLFPRHSARLERWRPSMPRLIESGLQVKVSLGRPEGGITARGCRGAHPPVSLYPAPARPAP